MGGGGLWQGFSAAIGLGIALLASSSGAEVTWADFVTTPLVVDIPTTVDLGGGSSMQITVTTGGTREVNPSDQTNLGAEETGLAYSHLYMFGLYNGGGFGPVTTTITLSNFVVAPDHQRGFIAVGALAAISTNVVATSSVPGSVQLWEAVGLPFDFPTGNTGPISWNASTGTIERSPVPGVDSQVIVIDVGSLAGNGTIQLSFAQHLNDGVVFAIGEETSTPPPVPALGPLAFGGATVLLLATGAVALRPSPNPSPKTRSERSR